MCLMMNMSVTSHVLFFFFNDTATTEIYTLSLHDALPIFDIVALDETRGCAIREECLVGRSCRIVSRPGADQLRGNLRVGIRSEEHTSELQSRQYLVCRLLLEKKKYKPTPPPNTPLLISFL